MFELLTFRFDRKPTVTEAFLATAISVQYWITGASNKSIWLSSHISIRIAFQCVTPSPTIVPSIVNFEQQVIKRRRSPSLRNFSRLAVFWLDRSISIWKHVRLPRTLRNRHGAFTYSRLLTPFAVVAVQTVSTRFMCIALWYAVVIAIHIVI